MKHLKKILALVIIATFLASVPMVLAEGKPHLVKVVFEMTADAKPPNTPGGGGHSGGGGDKGSGASGYSLLGVSWKNQINIDVSPALYDAVSLGVAEWSKYASSTNFVYTIDSVSGPLTVAADGANEVMFGEISNDKIIAQTSIWYDPSTNEIVEFDIVFNTHFTWGDATENSAVMDTQNIATHELGHGFGLADLYQPKWSIETMYGYANTGQTDKRSLEAGDIAGIQAIYGAP